MKPILIATADGARVVQGEPQGALAVHRAHRLPGYTVTHLPTGHGLLPDAICLTRGQARELRSRLLAADVEWEFTERRPPPETRERIAAVCREYLRELGLERLLPRRKTEQ